MGSLDCDCAEWPGLIAPDVNRPAIECTDGGLLVRTAALGEDDNDIALSAQIDPTSGALWAPKRIIFNDVWGRTDFQATLPYDSAAAHTTGPSPVPTTGSVLVTTDSAGGGTVFVVALHAVPAESTLVKFTVGTQIHVQSGSHVNDGIQIRLQGYVTGGIAYPTGHLQLLDYHAFYSKRASMRQRIRMRGETWLACAGSEITPTPDFVQLEAQVSVRATGHTASVLALDSLWVVAEMN